MFRPLKKKKLLFVLFYGWWTTVESNLNHTEIPVNSRFTNLCSYERNWLPAPDARLYSKLKKCVLCSHVLLVLQRVHVQTLQSKIEKVLNMFLLGLGVKHPSSFCIEVEKQAASKRRKSCAYCLLGFGEFISKLRRRLSRTRARLTGDEATLRGEKWGCFGSLLSWLHDMDLVKLQHCKKREDNDDKMSFERDWFEVTWWVRAGEQCSYKSTIGNELFWQQNSSNQIFRRWFPAAAKSKVG